jgi:hypothetical protein
VSRLGAALVGAAAILSGCMYHNALYNAERIYREAERHRGAGRDSLAAARYRDVVRRTAEAYRARPEDERVPRLLLLLGRAQLRLGETQAARLALEEAARTAPQPGLRSEVGVYLAIAEAWLGQENAALARVDAALADTALSDHARAQARLLRGSLGVASGAVPGAWAELSAATAAPGLAAEAGLERLALSVRHGEREQARAAAAALLATRDAEEQLDTIAALVRAAAEQWGPEVASELLAPADSSHWPARGRGRIRLERARLRLAAGDTAGAFAEARAVSAERGEAGAEARLALADWQLSSARDLGAAASVRSVLLPAAGRPEIDRRLEALADVERLAGLGLDEPLGWFAAAEIARDRLGAPVLARGLFLAYADFDPSAPWAAKALLAALDAAVDEPDREWLRGRLEAHSDSPYVLLARGRSSAGFAALEEELNVRLREIMGR